MQLCHLRLVHRPRLQVVASGLRLSLQCSTAFSESNAKDFDFRDTPLPDFNSRGTGQQDEET